MSLEQKINRVVEWIWSLAADAYANGEMLFIRKNKDFSGRKKIYDTEGEFGYHIIMQARIIE